MGSPRGATGPIAPAPSPAQLAIRSGPSKETAERAVLELLGTLESEGSRRVYGADWREWLKWLGGDPLAVAASDVMRYREHMRERGLAASTRARRLSVVRAIYGHMVNSGLMAVNPAREVRGPKGQHEAKRPWLACDELCRLLGPAGDGLQAMRDRMVILTLALTGQRNRDVARAHIEDLVTAPTTSGMGWNVVVKGGKAATVGVTNPLRQELTIWIAHSGIRTGALFPVMAGPDALGDHSITPDTVREIVKAAARRAGVDPLRVTPHALRRSFVTLSGQAGVSLEDRQAAVLHASKTTTELYDRAARPLTTTAADAMAAMLLDGGDK